MVCWEATDLGEVLRRLYVSSNFHEPAWRLDGAEGEGEDDDGEINVEEIGHDPGTGQLVGDFVKLGILHEPLQLSAAADMDGCPIGGEIAQHDTKVG